MQEQSKAAAVPRPSGSAPSLTYNSAAMERQVRQVKGGGITPPVQVIASRMKPGSISNPVQHNRSAGASGATPSTAPATATTNQILKCPRCNSLNTKFCYYNNYSLLQPRHFCKNCRRYWTKGGALRNVPVGGGCRKNKRTTATTTSSGSGTSPNMTAMTTTSSPSCGATKQGSMNMMIRENSASCRNSSITTSAVQKAALQESMAPPIANTQFSSIYSYTSKTGQIQPANSLSNSTASFYNAASDHSNLAQYPLLNPRLTHFMPPNEASFHSFLNLKQAISSLASPNHNLISFNASLPALPFLSTDHHISTANLDAALQAPINDPLIGLDLINVSTTASLVPLPSVTTTHSTTAASSSSLFINNTHSNDRSNSAAEHHLKSILPSCNDQKMNAFYRNVNQQELQAFGSSLSAAGSACNKGMQEIMHAAAAAAGSQGMQQEMHIATSSQGLQDHMQHAAAIMGDQGQLMQLMSSSSMKDELVSDNFKIKGDEEEEDNDQPAGAAICTNGSWGGGAHRSSFLEASGDDHPYWSCNPATWSDDLST